MDLDPGFSVFFTPESEFGMRKKILVQNPESGINIPEHNSEGSGLSTTIFGSTQCCGCRSEIRCFFENPDPESVINIPDQVSGLNILDLQHCSKAIIKIKINDAK